MTPYSGYNGFKSARYNVRDQQLTSACKLLNERKFMKRLKRYMGYAFHETGADLKPTGSPTGSSRPSSFTPT